ncbi:MAG: diguanylate cyclase [Pseudomonadota bacterium]|nr:diguanylate cyclase [Pseudomonadota bacterium]
MCVSLVTCDIDYFKQFNDLYGRQEGDECIRSFARVLESYCRRRGDLATRIGGEEFVLLPSTDHAAALKLAEHTRAAFDDLAIQHEGSKIKDNVTASFGVSTTMPDDTGAGETLMGLADKALYMAKGQGRNQVVSESLVGISAVAGE